MDFAGLHLEMTFKHGVGWQSKQLELGEQTVDEQFRDAFSTTQDPLCQTQLLSAAAGSGAATGAPGREPPNEDLLGRWWSTVLLLLLK